jgi:hypothetical protein
MSAVQAREDSTPELGRSDIADVGVTAWDPDGRARHGTRNMAGQFKLWASTRRLAADVGDADRAAFEEP